MAFLTGLPARSRIRPLSQEMAPTPGVMENLDHLTPFGAVYRYDDYDVNDSSVAAFGNFPPNC